MSTITIFSHSVKYEWGRTDSSNVVTRLRLIYKAWKLWLVKREWKRVGERRKPKYECETIGGSTRKKSQRRWWKAWASKLERQRRQCLWAVDGGDELCPNCQGLLQLSWSSQISLRFLVSILITILQDTSKTWRTEFSHDCKSHRVTLSQRGLCMYDICKDMVRM